MRQLLILCCFMMMGAAANAAIPVPKPRPMEAEILLPAELAPVPGEKEEAIEMPNPPAPPPPVAAEEKPAPAPQKPKALCNEDAFDHLEVGAKLRITILGHEDISRETEIGPKGTVTIPLVGEVQAEGETTKSLEKNILEKLEAAYLVSPGVEVEILQYPPFYMTGMVASPGLYDYKPRITVRQAVALAGGFSPRARTGEVKILRPNPKAPLQTLELTGDENTQVLPGDTIEVLRRWF